MTQDFAKIKPEPLLERKTVAPPPAWSLMATGIVVGIAIGVFACALVYLSGNIPPLNTATTVVASQFSAADETPAEAAEDKLELEFYSALTEYEVKVDSVPVPLAQDLAQDSLIAQSSEGSNEGNQLQDADLGKGFMLQTGAFQQQELAQGEMRRQQAIGLNVTVNQQKLLGRTLYLVQSGPYTSSRLLNEAEQILRQSDIPSLRMSLQ